MDIQVLFIQGGGGEEDYIADKKLATSLQAALGEGYNVRYPHLPNKSLPDFGRKEQILKEISALEGNAFLVGHSLGASMLLKTLSESHVDKKFAGIFLLATPFWSGDEDWVDAFRLRQDFADRLPKDVPIFLYHCTDDEEVPFAHMSIYRKELPQAIVREIESGGHQINDDLSVVANDMKSL